ncbi:centromere protein K [Engraulis encrasicolus]|uniref:centromere protein K n=1 Tax=Engraulis encrasicolus TaxID=184585 RepID=UPI002FD03A77
MAVPFRFEESSVVDSCSSASKEEILDECEDVFARLQKFQSLVISADNEACDGDRNETPGYLNALAAELDELNKMEPKWITTNPEILAAVGVDELTTLNEGLDLLVMYHEVKRTSLRESLNREKGLLEERKLVLSAVTDQVETVRQEKNRTTERSKLQEMKVKIEKMKGQQAALTSKLSDLLAEHFPAPTPDLLKKQPGRKKTTPNNPVVLLPLSKVLELLTNKTLDTPHDPYVTTDESFWPPYVEMLLRYGIATRHSEDCSKIRLENLD